MISVVKRLEMNKFSVKNQKFIYLFCVEIPRIPPAGGYDGLETTKKRTPSRVLPTICTLFCADIPSYTTDWWICRTPTDSKPHTV